jgi:nucleotide-binding universal stress UspA family protein
MRLFSNILYVVGERDGLPGLMRAISLTKREGGSITIVSVVETAVTGSSSGRFYNELNAAFDALRNERLASLEALAKSVPNNIAATYEVMDGRSYLEIIKRVQLYQHDLVVANAVENSLKGPRFFISEEMQLLRKCPCPVLLINSDQTGPFQRVMATLDFEYYDTPDEEYGPPTLNDEILETAVTIASEDKGRLDVVNIYEVPGEGAIEAGWIRMNNDNYADYANSCQANSERRVGMQVERSKRRLGDNSFEGAQVKTHLVRGRARDAIPDLANDLDTDLIVMGTIGRVGVAGLLIGNTAETILNRIDCSVLALKPFGFETPIMID